MQAPSTAGGGGGRCPGPRSRPGQQAPAQARAHAAEDLDENGAREMSRKLVVCEGARAGLWGGAGGWWATCPADGRQSARPTRPSAIRRASPNLPPTRPTPKVRLCRERGAFASPECNTS
jgi:hypothetical protein